MKTGDIIYGRVVAITQDNNIPKDVKVKIDDTLEAYFPGSELRGIYSADQSGLRTVSRRYMGHKLPLMVTGTNPLTVSYAQALVKLAEGLPEMVPGFVFTGIVTNIQQKQAEITYRDCVFTTMPASEYGWTYRSNLKDDLETGEPIKVEVTEVKDGQIYVSHRKYSENPWPSFAKYYLPGNQYLGRVKAVLKDQRAIIANIEKGLDVYCTLFPFRELKRNDEITIEMLAIDIDQCKANGTCIGLAFSEC